MSSLTSGAPERGRGFVGGFGDAPVEWRIAGQLIEMLADQRSGNDAKHAIERRVGHADDAAAVGQHDALVHDLDGQRLAAQHFLVGLSIRDVVHHADETAHLAVRGKQRLVGEVNPARLTAQRLQRHLHVGAFALANSLAPLERAGVVGRKKYLAPAEAIHLFESAAEELIPAGTRPHDLRLAVFVDRGLVDEARRELGHRAIAEFAFAQRVGRLFAFGDVDRDADQAREPAGGRIGDRAILHLDPAQLAIRATDLRRELHGLAAQITLGAPETLFAQVVTLDKAQPAAAPVFLFAAAVDAFGAEAPFELVHTARIHEVFVHRAFRQIGDGAIARVVQRQAAFVGLAAVDVARVRDDAAHRRIGERVDRDALEPAPAAIAMTEAVFEAIQFRLRVARAAGCPRNRSRIASASSG